MYYFVFFQLFQLSKYIKDNIPGSIFYDTVFDGIMLLSVFEILNIASIWLYFDITSIFNNITTDFILGLLGLFTINYFIFMYKDRYKEIIKTCDSKLSWYRIIGQAISLIYTVGTVYVFYILHSGNNV